MYPFRCTLNFVLFGIAVVGCRSRETKTVTKPDHLGPTISIQHKAANRLIIRGIPHVVFICSERNELVIEGAQAEVAKVLVVTRGGSQTIEYPGGNSKDPDLLVTVYATTVKEMEASALGSLRLAPVLDVQGARVNLHSIGTVWLVLNGGALEGTLRAIGRADISGKLSEGHLQFSGIASLNIDKLSRGRAQVQMNSIALFN